jgi:hypothetical protein
MTDDILSLIVIDNNFQIGSEVDDICLIVGLPRSRLDKHSLTHSDK